MAYLFPVTFVLPEMMEATWARALPGRESAERNEVSS